MIDQAAIYERFRGKGTPVLLFGDEVITSSFLWIGMREWVERFRSLNLKKGDRLVVDLKFDEGFILILLASMWEGITFCPLSSTESIEPYDPSLLITQNDIAHFGLPSSSALQTFTPTSEPTPGVQFIFTTSGTTSEPKHIAISHENLASIIDSHTPLFNLEKSHLLSVLPWNHPFGLIIELLPALFHSDLIVRDPEGGKNLKGLLAIFTQHTITHFNSVPSLIEKLIAIDPTPLLKLRGGTVGGAPVSASLADFLSETFLQVGYGMTEASPGISLGLPGEWSENILGTPIGCDVKIEPDHTLTFKGKNVCYGFWKNKTLIKNDPTHYFQTNDLVKRENDTLYFIGRKDFCVKLPNGKMIQTDILERKIKKQLPQLSEIFFQQKEGLQIYYTSLYDNMQTAITKELDYIAPYITSYTQLKPSALSYTLKGTLNKEQTLRNCYVKRN